MTDEDIRGHKGNSASKAFTQLLSQAAGNLARVDTNLERWADEGLILKGLSIKSALYTDDGSWVLTVRAAVDGRHVVAFHSATTLLELLNGFSTRWTNKSLKWRDDDYAR